MNILIIRIIRFFLIALYGTEFATVSVITYSIFDVCLLSFSVLLVFLALLSILIACEAFDDLLGLKNFSRNHHRIILGVKFLLIFTVLGSVWLNHNFKPNNLHFGVELYLIFLIEVVVFVLVELKKHSNRSKRQK